MTTKTRYDVYLNMPTCGLIHAADCILVEDDSVLTQVGIRYCEAYLSSKSAISIDPHQLPLKAGEQVLQCRGGVPAFLDDYLPDAWGRKVLARLALYKHQQQFNANSVIDTLGLLSDSRIGALSIVPRGEKPHFKAGHPLEALERAEQAAQLLDDSEYAQLDLNEMNLVYLANTSTGVGGARPKALLYDSQQQFIAKFNRHSQDRYNNARVELACLLMAKGAGLEVGSGRVITGINSREVLLLDRFDVAPSGQRYHLISANGLLKERHTQRDPGNTFRYDNLCELLRRYSVAIEADLNQLLRLMVFNRAINNTDDHERNFSLINRGQGYQLSPAYDLVPSLATGEYHAAGFGYQPSPPRPTELNTLGKKIFGLSKTTVADIASQVQAAIAAWPHYAEKAGVSEQESKQVMHYFHP